MSILGRGAGGRGDPDGARRCLEEGRARGHDVLWLGVWEHNARARAFYARWGFAEVGEMRFLLGSDPQRELVLELKL